MGQGVQPVGLADRIQQMSTGLKTAAKSSAMNGMSLILKLVSGFFLGLVLSLIFQTLFGYSSFAFFLVLISFMSLTVRLLWNWGFGGILIFDLICVLLFTVLRMYILMAP